MCEQIMDDDEMYSLITYTFMQKIKTLVLKNSQISRYETTNFKF